VAIASPESGPLLVSRAVIAVLVTIHCILCVLLIVMVLMHSGKDAGLSGAFGVGGSGSAYGGSSAIVEKNLTRITVVICVLFFLSTYVLGRAL
jgi:preprotein translocase subunit SecG